MVNGIMQNSATTENIIKLAIQKMILDPKLTKGRDLENIDPEQLSGGKSLFKMG